MRSRLIPILALMAIIASACGSTAETVDLAAPAEVAAVADEATSTTTADSTLLPSGRERILANHTEGKPYVLWYWGAH